MLSGEKTDGVKTYTGHANKLFGDSCQPKKFGNYYLSRLTKYSDDGKLLDDKNYLALRPIGSPEDLPLQSKPGIFGWNKIDQGSALLINQFPQFVAILWRGQSAPVAAGSRLWLWFSCLCRSATGF